MKKLNLNDLCPRTLRRLRRLGYRERTRPELFWRLARKFDAIIALTILDSCHCGKCPGVKK
jgi:hypothetical protein